MAPEKNGHVLLGGDSHRSKNDSLHIYLNSFIQLVWEINSTEMI